MNARNAENGEYEVDAEEDFRFRQKNSSAFLRYDADGLRQWSPEPIFSSLWQPFRIVSKLHIWSSGFSLLYIPLKRQPGSMECLASVFGPQRYSIWMYRNDERTLDALVLEIKFLSSICLVTFLSFSCYLQVLWSNRP